MKKIRFIALCLALTLFVGLLAGCSGSMPNGSDGRTENSSTKDSADSTNSNSSASGTPAPLTGTVTLKQYLDNGPKVGFYGEYPLDKDASPSSMYLFENGKLYFIVSLGEYDRDTKEYALTWGEIAKMSDEELLAHVRKYTASHRAGSFYHYEFDPNTANIYVSPDTSDTYIGEPTGLEQYIKKPGDYMFAVREYNIQSGMGVIKVEGDHGLFSSSIGLYYYDDDNDYIIRTTLDFDVFGNLYLNEYDAYEYDGRYGDLKLPELTLKWSYDSAMTTGDYTLHVTTDNTGNRTTKEQISVETVREWTANNYFIQKQETIGPESVFDLYNFPPAKGTVYGSTFSVLFTNKDRDRGLIFRTGNGLTLTLDKPGDEGVEVD
ncbi:MAG: hypothetical protein J1E00_01910 [Oscillospiraceae bacterium]|nr:hypothetical protein [Oscillospiraceae bacterium]